MLLLWLLLSLSESTKEATSLWLLLLLRRRGRAEQPSTGLRLSLCRGGAKQTTGLLLRLRRRIGPEQTATTCILLRLR